MCLGQRKEGALFYFQARLMGVARVVVMSVQQVCSLCSSAFLGVGFAFCQFAHAILLAVTLIPVQHHCAVVC